MKNPRGRRFRPRGAAGALTATQDRWYDFREDLADRLEISLESLDSPDGLQSWLPHLTDRQVRELLAEYSDRALVRSTKPAARRALLEDTVDTLRIEAGLSGYHDFDAWENPQYGKGAFKPRRARQGGRSRSVRARKPSASRSSVSTASPLGTLVQHLHPEAVFMEHPTDAQMQKAIARTPTIAQLRKARKNRWGLMHERILELIDIALRVREEEPQLKGPQFWERVRFISFRGPQAVTPGVIAECPTCGTRPATTPMCKVCGARTDGAEPRRNPRGSVESPLDNAVVLPDSGWCDPDDLWGIGIDGLSCPLGQEQLVKENPSYSAPAWAHQALLNYGLKLSANPKTILCFSTIQWLSCAPSALCRQMCYGKSGHYEDHSRDEAGELISQQVRVLEDNSYGIMQDWDDQQIRDIAAAIRAVCNHYGIDNIRWHGVGDLVLGAELALLDELTADGTFVVWGFTRKGNVLERLPVRDNLCFWPSLDKTMRGRMFDKQVRAMEKHGTGFSYMTYHGVPYLPRVSKSKPWEPPRKKGSLTTDEKRGLYDPNPDPMLESLLAEGYPVSVVFGYHGAGRTTHVGVANECPATDPHGGGHFVGACQQCGWCIRKPGQKLSGADSLKANRQRYVDADSFQNRSLGKIWLDDGSKR